MRRFALALMLVGVAVLALLLILGREHGRTSPELPDERDEHARDVSSSALTSTDERRGEPPEEAHPAPVVGEMESATHELPLRLSGSLALTDGRGEEHFGENARFTLMLWSDESAKGFAVEVTAGNWSVELAPRAGPFETFSVQGFQFGPREAKGEHGPEERLVIPADGRVDLRAHFPAEVLLHVQAQETGAELDEAIVVDDVLDERLPHPGWLEHLPKAKTCPLVLAAPLAAPNDERHVVYVGAPGRAWKRVELFPGTAERVVQLAPGGDLRVSVRSGAIDPGTRLRIFPADSASIVPLAELELGMASERLVRGLPVGTYDVAGQLGDGWHVRRLGSVRVDVSAGATSEATLVLEAVEAPTWVPFEGTVRLPTAWNLDAFELIVELQGAPLGGWDGALDLSSASMELFDPVAGAYRWKTKVQPGNYALFVPQTGVLETLDVGATGVLDALVAVPPPCVLVVRCVDEDGSEVEASLGWGFVSDAGMIQGTIPFVRDDGRGTWQLRAPMRTLVVRGFRWGQSVERTVELGAGRNEIELRFPALTGIEVLLQDGSTRVPWESGRLPSLRPLEGQAVPDVTERTQERVVLEAQQPGAYVLSIPDLPGYRSVPDATVQLQRGKLLRRVVDLRRKP